MINFQVFVCNECKAVYSSDVTRFTRAEAEKAGIPNTEWWRSDYSWLDCKGCKKPCTFERVNLIGEEI